MPHRANPRVKCMICGKETLASACVSADALRGSLAEHIKQEHPDTFDPAGRVCFSCLNQARSTQLLAELERERGELTAIEEEVSRKATEHIAITEHIDAQFESKLTFGQRVADQVAAVGGSWGFLISFALVLTSWIALNSALLRAHAFDPFPYILLNLVLSCLAAVQAPVIMMSQNRAAARDRLEADEDYKVNLKAELEIATLHQKVDHLLHVQWERMVEIQKTQLELLNELLARRP